MSDSSPAIAIDGLAKRFGRQWVLAHISVEVPPGGTLLVTGPNGAGKSTLLGILATAVPFEHGNVVVTGNPLPSHAIEARRTTAYVGHLGGSYRTLTARENLRIWSAHLDASDDGAIGRALHRMDLEAAADRPVDGFSAGMRRRLALARALLQTEDDRRRLVILDEPYEQLDRPGFRLIDSLLDEWNERGMTVVLATHLVERALPHSSHVLHIDGGRSHYFGASSSFDPRDLEVS
ncbi:MAG: heme ABC exporter ATP-binding protein CcmA [Acidobacteria bacterium]|nr:heme ABC exporter ATP-binding protein CcmA [Acidobacteriota bacterium]